MEKVNKGKSSSLSSKQKKCIDLLVYNGLSQKEIAGVLNVTEKTLWQWKQTTLFMAALDAELEQAKLHRRRQYNIKANKAVEKITSLMNCGDPKVEFNAAKELIRLAGDEPTTNVQLSVESDGLLDAISGAAVDWSGDD